VDKISQEVWYEHRFGMQVAYAWGVDLREDDMDTIGRLTITRQMLNGSEHRGIHLNISPEDAKEKWEEAQHKMGPSYRISLVPTLSPVAWTTGSLVETMPLNSSVKGTDDLLMAYVMLRRLFEDTVPGNDKKSFEEWEALDAELEIER